MKKKNELSNEKIGKVVGGRDRPRSAICPWCSASVIQDNWENHVNRGFGCAYRKEGAKHQNFPR